MSEDAVHAASDQTKLTTSQPGLRVVQQVDGMLQTIIEQTNATGVGFDVTLMVQGALVSGTTIRNVEYLRLLSEQCKTVIAEGYPVGAVATAVQALETHWKDAAEAWNESQNAPRSVHLRDVKIHYPTPVQSATPAAGILWRGMLEQVSGFFLGRPV